MAQNLSNLPIGSKIKFGKHSVNGETAQDIIWLVVNKSPNITLLTEKVIDFRSFDAKEPNSSYTSVRSYGFGRYSVSNLAQWLNSEAGEGAWYRAQHDGDQAPTVEHVTNNTQYSQRPGFLSNFTSSERNAILTTTVLTSRSFNTPDPNDPVNHKVFIPSAEEITTDWAYFTNGSNKRCMATSQAKDNSVVSPKQSSTYHPWWTRNSTDSVTYMRYVDEAGTLSFWENTNNGINVEPYRGWIGVRPALNLSATLSISDTTDNEGCYTFIWNSAPPVPTTLNVPTIYGGKSSTISWGKVTDPDGHTVTYQLEQSLNGGAYTSLYSGANLSFTTVVPAGSTTVQFRLKAVDSMGASSGYITSTSRTVVNNSAPTISGTNGSLGTKSSGFTQTYTVTDANSNPVTVTESIDGVQVRSYVVTLGATNTFSVTGNTWVALANGNHTLTITATDGIDSSTRTYTFTKSVSSFTIQNSTAMTTSARPTRIKVSVNRTIPPEATLKIEVCNNGFDSSPTWEDATQSMRDGLVYLFSNTTKTATNWGVRIRVTVNRNGGSGACYVSSIGGNWE